MFGQHLPNKCLFAGVESKVAFFVTSSMNRTWPPKKTATSITFGITTKKENPVVVFSEVKKYGRGFFFKSGMRIYRQLATLAECRDFERR